MDAAEIKRLRPALAAFLGLFADCLGRDSNFAHLQAYVEGQFGDLERKNVEAIANALGVSPRTLQEFLATYEWGHECLRPRIAEIVAREHGGPGAIGILDETSFVKKGKKTPGVQRQYCGAVGKRENCMVTVHLAYARRNFHCLLDGDLFLPESWQGDRERCREAGIPDDVVYRPKSEIALELWRRARANGVVFELLTFDEWYGSKPAFLGALADASQKYVGEVPKNQMVWFSRPQVTERPFRRGGRGRSRATPRVTRNSPQPKRLDEGYAVDADLCMQSWEPWHVKDTEKGPKVVEVKSKIVYPKGEDGLPLPPHHLLVVRDVRSRDQWKWFLAHAPENAERETLLKIAFSRWRVERCFQDDKGRIGLDHYEGRRYQGLIRHLMISAVSLLFLARMREKLGIVYEELTVRQMRMAVDAMIQSLWLSPVAGQRVIDKAARIIQYHQKRNAQARRSHTKARVRELESMGIDLATINRCDWDTT